MWANLKPYLNAQRATNGQTWFGRLPNGQKCSRKLETEIWPSGRLQTATNYVRGFQNSVEVSRHAPNRTKMEGKSSKPLEKALLKLPGSFQTDQTWSGRFRGGACVSCQGLGLLILRRAVGFSQRPDEPLAPHAAVCGTESSVARWRAYGSGAPSPAGFGAFALLSGPGLTQCRDCGI